MSNPKYTSTYGAALNLATFAQPVATTQILTLDEQLDQLINAGQIAKAEGNTDELARLRLAYLELKAQIEAVEAAPEAASFVASYVADNAPVSARDAEIVQAVATMATTVRTVALNLDCLIAAHEAQPDSKAQQNAWEWLAPLTSVTMQGNAYRIPSAKWSNTLYTATATTCSCEAHKRCWHQHAAATLDLARENQEIERLAQLDHDGYVAAYATAHRVAPLDWDPDCKMHTYRDAHGLVRGMRQYPQVAVLEGVLVRENDALTALLECFA